MARRAASSAANCAANGVLLRDPLNPRDPELAHDTVLPLTSVMVMMVLLNVDLICAIPAPMFLRTVFLAVRFFAVAILL